MLTLPILKNHDQSQIIGKVTAEEGGLIVEMLPGNELSREQMFSIFGGACCIVLEWSGDLVANPHIKKFRIAEFSQDEPSA